MAWEGEERGYANNDRPEDLIAYVKVVMSKPAVLMRQNPVIGILRGVLRHADPRRPTLLHTLEDEVDSIGLLLDHSA